MVLQFIFFSFSVLSPIDDNILFSDESVRSEKDVKSRAFTRLTPDELPVEGTIVALDAEFVTLNQVCTSILYNYGFRFFYLRFWPKIR